MPSTRSVLVPGPTIISSMLLAALGCTVGCGPVGEAPDPTGPLRILHVVLLDQARGLNPDLFNNQPGRPCTSTEPCLPPLECGKLVFSGPGSGTQLILDVPDPPSGDICHDPEDIREVEPSVDAVIRVAFDQHIDLTGLELENGDLDPTLMTLSTTADPPVAIPGAVRYDRSGSPDFSSDPNAFPYGPALVFDPDAPLAPATSYRLTLDTPRLRSRSQGGSAILPSQATHDFTTEALRVLDYQRCPGATAGRCANINERFALPDPEGPDPPEVAPNQALAFQLTAHIRPDTLDGIRVEDAGGQVVATRATTPIVDPASECPPAPARILYIVPVDPQTGEATSWNPGEYHLLIPGGPGGVQARDSDARTAADYNADFTITDLGTEVDDSDPFAIGVNVLLCP